MLLADFHIHTTWSDGKLSIPEVVDLFGRAGHDAIAITDHVVNSDTLVGKATHHFGLTVTERNFPAYREEIEREKRRALDQYGMVVIPGFELTQNTVTRKNSAHVLALGVDEFISADGSVEEMLMRAQKQSRIVVACHPHEQSDWFSNTFYLWNRRNEVRAPRRPLGGRLPLRSLPAGRAGASAVHRQQRFPSRGASVRLEDARPRAQERAGDLPRARAGNGPRSNAARGTVLRGERMTASFVLGLIALLGTIVTTMQALLTRRFRRSSQERNRRTDCDPRSAICDLPLISILKPVCGLDDELEENLVSFTRLEGIRYEVIISAEEWDDPAVDVVRRVMRMHPEAPFRLVVDGGSRHGVVNRKVERLIAAVRVAAGDLFVISDSNVRVQPDDLARTISAFADPSVGCVSNLFTGAGARSLGAVIESLHLLGFVVPGAVMAAAIHTPCVVGKSMAIPRRVHDAIGGFERFRRVLAEDQAIGLAVKEAGYDVVLSPVVVRNVIVQRDVKRAFDRQVRWNKIRFSFSHSIYLGELLLNPFVFAVAAALLEPERLALFPFFVAAARCLQMALLSRATRARLSARQLAATPILDALMFAAWFVPFFSNRITWRGYEARIGRGTEMIERAA